MKTVVIDAQLWQTNAWFRGMGAYTRSLLAAYTTLNKDTKLHFILNGNLPAPVDRINQINTEFPDAQIHQLNLPAHALEDKAAVAVLDRFMQDQGLSKQKDLTYAVLSLFMFDYCANFPSYGKRVLLNYDLIPLINWQYFKHLFPPHLYFQRFIRFYEADLVLVISETTAKDTERYLGISPSKIRNIDGAAEPPQHNKAETKSEILNQLKLKNTHFILMPTGGFPHKNALRAVEAFAVLADVSSQDIRLVATSFFEDNEMDELRLLSNKVIFTGNITDADMVELYRHCRTVLMPSLSEGLGIPVLEAVLHDKPVACSDIAVFREIPHHKQAFYMFDPLDVNAIYNNLMKALAQADFIEKRDYYPKITAKYNWQRSAQLLTQALDEVSADRKTRRLPLKKKSIAVLCPDPRLDPEVGRFAQNLWGYGQEMGIEIVYFIDSGGIDPSQAAYPDYIRTVALCYDIDDYYGQQHRESFLQTVCLLTDDPLFSKVFLAALKAASIVFLGKNRYDSVIKRLAEQDLISPEQQQAERFIAQNIVPGVCDAVSVIAGARAIIMDSKNAESVGRAQKLTGNNAPTLMLNLDNESESCQQLIDFILDQDEAIA